MASLVLLALLVLHGVARLSILDPRNIGWMQYGDWMNYLHGWRFYRWDEWRFPIGYFSNLLHPVGTSIGLTDSIPWPALIAKIFAPWLPSAFQYFGAYLLLCFFLQGLLGFRIMMLLSSDRIHSLLTAAFLMLAPVLLDRINHIALCSHWLILALILWHVSSATSAPSSAICRKATALNLIAAITHPYIWAMTFVMSLPLFARPRRAGAPFSTVATSFAFWTSTQVAIAVLGWWVFGYMALGSIEDTGFGVWGGAILGFFHSAGRTAFTPPLTAIKPPQEAFDFLGLGIVLVAAILVVTLVKRWLADSRESDWSSGPWLPSSPFFPLLLITTGFWLFSLGRTAPFFAALGPLPGAFRSSGRFSWPLYYCVILFLLWRYRRAFPSHAASAVLLLLLLLQVCDLTPYWRAALSSQPIPQVGRDPFWRRAEHRFRHLVLWPQGSGMTCGPKDLFTLKTAEALLFYAADQRMTINVGTTSRAPTKEIRAACEVTRLELSEDRPEVETLYVIHPSSVPRELLAALQNFSCRQIDGLQVCAAATPQ